MIFDFNLELLLEDRYNIQLNEYWDLPQRYKDEITSILFNIIIIMLNSNHFNYQRYIDMLDDIIELESFNEQYEKASILNTLKDKLTEKYVLY